MKTLMALVLSLGMALLGTAPVMAAGQAMQAAAPLKQSKVVQVVVPGSGDSPDSELSPSDLAEVKGQGAQDVIAGVMFIGSAYNDMRDAAKSTDALKAGWAAVEFVVGVGLAAWGIGTALLPSP